ncbi:MAG: Xaa-Pro peptidase family protein [Proteobacteria bacterium]|nr:Xaa-Pro peptidase family protein [Pseudomonadota bacterium]
MPPFTRAEYLDRIAKTKARMEKAGIDVLLVTSPANMFYLTGYDGCSFYTHQMAILALEAEEPIWAGRGLDLTSARLTAFMAEENIRGYEDDFVGAVTRHPMQFMAELLREKGWDKLSVGVEMDGYYFTARCWEVLQRELPDATFRDGDLLVNKIRLVKSDTELALMREAGEIGTRTARATIEGIAVGARESVPVSQLYATQIAGTDSFGGDYACKPPVFCAGPRIEAVHLTWQDRVFAEGDLTWFETCGVRHHYHAPISRTVYLGTPPTLLVDRAKVLVEALEAALAAARPGNTCADIAMAWHKVAGAAGIEKNMRIGYPVGIGFSPTWGELACGLSAEDETELQPGMTFHAIPGIWEAEVTVVISESFEVTEGGSHRLTDLPMELIVKD